ncbi:MAG: adenylate/guanylate cyclase domain-containing protein [Candidatus Altimarinota bacterium]
MRFLQQIGKSDIVYSMQFARNLKHIFIIWCIAFLLILLGVKLFDSTFTISFTHYFVYRNSGIQSILFPYHFSPSKDIALIKIDDASLNAYQAQRGLKMLTIPKSRYANIVRLLESASVKGIAFDIIFQNVDPSEDLFIKTLSANKNIVIASSYKKNAVCVAGSGGLFEDCEGIPRKPYQNIPWGLINHYEQGDRRPFVVDVSGTTYSDWKTDTKIYTLPLALANILNLPYEKSRYENQVGKDFLIPYFGGSNTYAQTTYGFNDVLSMRSDELEEAFSGKYVFIGEGGSIIHDQFLSPVSSTMMDGVDSHAHLFDGILQGRYLEEFSMRDLGYKILIGFIALFLIVFSLFLPKYISPIFALLSILLLIVASRYLYFHYGYVFQIDPLILAGGVLTFPLTFIYRFFVIDKEKRLLTSAFSHYVDGRVVEKIAASGKPINLGGESRRLSILFSDIAGFTTLSEKLPPTDLFLLMSSYLSKMTEILTQNGGTLDKYIGDAVMGFYGAPLDDERHAYHACETALKMREILPQYNQEIAKQGLGPIDFRVGIATGDVLVGNIGSANRFNYTVLGDTANLASRLESASKEYGTHIIVSESTYLDTKEFFSFRKLDKIAVKGKNEGVCIYELVAKGDSQTLDGSLGYYKNYEDALELYFQGKYLEAGKLFEKYASVDVASALLARRCLDILEGRLKITDGIYRMEYK